MKLKRLPAPRTWPIERKGHVFAPSFLPGPHEKELAMPLLLWVRDVLKIAKNAREAKRIIKEGKVAIDGKVRKDHRFPVGLMDVLWIRPTDEFYRISIERGKLAAIKIPEELAWKKVCMIKRKVAAPGGKVQISLHDSRNFLLNSTDLRVGDSVLINLKEDRIEKELRLEKGVKVLAFKGRHAGAIGEVKEIKRLGHGRDKVVCEGFETLKRYVMPIGDERLW